MTLHADKTLIGIILKKNNMGLWLLGQATALCIGAAVSIVHDWSLGCAAGFAIMVLVDIRGQIGKES